MTKDTGFTELIPTLDRQQSQQFLGTGGSNFQSCYIWYLKCPTDYKKL